MRLDFLNVVLTTAVLVIALPTFAQAQGSAGIEGSKARFEFAPAVKGGFEDIKPQEVNKNPGTELRKEVSAGPETLDSKLSTQGNAVRPKVNQMKPLVSIGAGLKPLAQVPGLTAVTPQ